MRDDVRLYCVTFAKLIIALDTSSDPLTRVLLATVSLRSLYLQSIALLSIR